MYLQPRRPFPAGLAPESVVRLCPLSSLVFDDLAAARWVQTYDAAWLGKDWKSLEGRLAPEVIFVIPTAPEPLVGRVRVLASIRDGMSDVRMHEYNATDLHGHDCAGMGVITYRWQLDCTVGQERT